MFPDHDDFGVPEFDADVFANARTAIFFHEDFILHKTGNHPESPRRLVVMKGAIEDNPVNKSVDWKSPRLCDEEEILRCHTRGHLESVKHAAEKASASPDQLVRLDMDTVVCSDSFRAAKRAVGAACDAVDAVVKDGYQTAWALVRPPGHHATPERSMGFCLFNNAACAAEHARAVHGFERIMIIDYDLHHGNGTQDIFYEDAGVLYTSIHQSYHYPGTGHIDEVGEGVGRGYTVNFPVLAGSGNSEFGLYFREVVTPIMLQYKPELLIVSAGFDAHALDPLGSLQVTGSQFGAITTLLRANAAKMKIGLVHTLEGGYSLEAQAESVVECMTASTATVFKSENLPFAARPSQGAVEAIDRLRAAHGGKWRI
jgi:acetoin utilization deacetylase AcuC-like enzyme